MFKKLVFTSFILALLLVNAQAQTVEELKAQKAEKEAQISALQGEVGALKNQIATFPGWKFKAVGTLGLNFSQFNNWLSSDSPDTYTSSYGFS